MSTHNEFIEPATEEWDTEILLTKRRINVLDEGFVELVDWMPRKAPLGRTPEFGIVQAARVSTGAGIKSVSEDNGLIGRLMRCRHTSPLERLKFVFKIRCPKFVRTHFIRHRTANVNEFSQRYAEVEESFYRPSNVPDLWAKDGMFRSQSEVDKQATVMIENDHNSVETKFDQIMQAFKDAEAHLEQCFADYRRLLTLGVPRELARFCLPDATYTELYFIMDLNNFLKFLGLRNDPKHAQSETVHYASAMEELVTPLIPTVMKSFHKWNRDAITFSSDESEAIRNGTFKLSTRSENLQREFIEKCEQLGLLPKESALDMITKSM